MARDARHGRPSSARRLACALALCAASAAAQAHAQERAQARPAAGSAPVSGLFGSGAPAGPTRDEELAALEQRADALSRQNATLELREAQHAIGGVLEQAKLALQRARTAKREDLAVRDKQIARAALELAQAMRARLEEERARTAAAQRAQAEEAAQKAAEQALQQAKQQRDAKKAGEP